MSPYGRIMEDMGFHIVVVMGLGEPIDLPVFRAGIETELLPRFPRFRCIQVILFASFLFQFHIFIITEIFEPKTTGALFRYQELALSSQITKNNISFIPPKLFTWSVYTSKLYLAHLVHRPRLLLMVHLTPLMWHFPQPNNGLESHDTTLHRTDMTTQTLC